MNRTVDESTNTKHDEKGGLPSILQVMEQQLRRNLIDRPNNAKLMSMLSVVLLEQQQQQQQKLFPTCRHRRKEEQSSSQLQTLDGNDEDDDCNNNDDENGALLTNEALQWAKKAIRTAPRKPYGYMALSQVSTNFQERIEALKTSTELLVKQQLLLPDYEANNNNDDDNNNNHGAVVVRSVHERIHWTLTRLSLLVRLLVEPREEEIRQVRGRVGSGSSNHPSRRDLTDQEMSVYHEIVKILPMMWTIITKNSNDDDTNNAPHKRGTRNGYKPNHDNDDDNNHSISFSDGLLTWKQREVLSHHEFRLGRFFRKKLPYDVHQSRARSHFTKSIRGYQMLLTDETMNHETNISSNMNGMHQSGGNDKDDGSIGHDGYDIARRYNDGTGCDDVKKNLEMARFWLATLRDVPQQHPDNNNGDVDKNRPSSTRGGLSKCPPEYVVGLYATFAERFDELLVEKLHYQTPTKLRRLLDSVLQVAGRSCRRFERGMDLGCGTGLSGIAFADLFGEGRGTFIGIDLSPEMAAKARTRHCYDSVMVGDVTQAFSIRPTRSRIFAENNNNDDVAKIERREDGCYDLVIACDVFCYLGDLSVVFEAVTESLRTAGSKYDGGFFCFSTECLTVMKDSPAYSLEYCLHECARFQHSEQYLRRLAADHDMDVIRLEKDTIRKNQGMDVTGWLVILQKRSDTKTRFISSSAK